MCSVVSWPGFGSKTKLSVPAAHCLLSKYWQPRMGQAAEYRRQQGTRRRAIIRQDLMDRERI